jgi:hypothetical protein
MIASGVGLSEVGRRFTMNRDALRRHRDRHMSVALTAFRQEQGHAVQVETTARDRVEALVAKLETLVERTDSEKRESMLLQASRELRGAIELLARLSGELRPESQINVAVVNLATSDEWQRTRSVILDRLRRHPDALSDVLDGLRQIASETPDVIDVTPRSDGHDRPAGSATVVGRSATGSEP